jgi:NAD-dependent deacetylase
MIKPEDFKRIVILTGAGISQESGLATFRDQNGLWEKYPLEEVATPEAFSENPQRVWKFYSLRRLHAASVMPNLAHLSLMKFFYTYQAKIQMTLITQNVDTLHQLSDPENKMDILPMHGSLNQSRCSNCEQVFFDDKSYFNLDEKAQLIDTHLCSESERASPMHLNHYNLKFQHSLPLSPCCQKLLRPHIVWFGEEPFYMKKIYPLVEACDLFVSIGTSGQVYPAAGLLKLAKAHGAKTVCLNKEEIGSTHSIDETILGLASETVPAFFKVGY